MVSIRTATESDVPAIFNMLRASAEEQGFPGELAVTQQDLAEDGFGASPKFNVLLAETAGEPCGMALWFFNYSTWGSRAGVYLEDLYVRPDCRRQRVAASLIRELAAIAIRHHCRRFQWVVHHDNASAIRLYQSLGARVLEDWHLMSVKGADLERLAGGSYDNAE